MDSVRLFLAGDVMTGRGIDQILHHPNDPILRESYIDDARAYVELAERAYGPITAPVEPSYVWGDGLAVFRQLEPSASIVNLETSITGRGEFWAGKGVHYRMHPENIGCLAVANIDVCAVANNHLLDFGTVGLVDTLDTLTHAGIQGVGAGRSLAEARRPARVELGHDATMLVFACGHTSSGIPREWAAGRNHPGIHLLTDLCMETADALAAHVRAHKCSQSIAIVSIHWGSNWGYEVDPQHRAFAHRLVEGGVDVVHGHSSHHVRPIEIYRGRLILYGCGDLISDYEGIHGHESWRGDIGVMYFADISPPDGVLAGLRLVPLQMRRLQLSRAAPSDGVWLRDLLNRFGRPFGCSFASDGNGALVLETGTGKGRRPHSGGGLNATA